LRFGARMLARFFQVRITRRFRREINIGDDIAAMIDKDDYLRRFLILLGMGRDRSTGTVELSPDDQPVIRWRMEASKLHYDRVRREMRKIARAVGGKFVDNPLTWFDKVIAVHPLGGCVMAETEQEGVVDVDGQVFGHPGLYVVDASILPTSTGPNPSLTIAAMAERIAERFPEKNR
ncbi:MAG TPA: GMC family oxidoreductase, partial [Desulfobulbus sp.]|nr:GMC family oxidoreductase [Desulfobulbus sp.]